MLEVEGRTTVLVVSFGIAVVLAGVGWLGMAWFRHLGMLWFILCLNVMVSSVPMRALGVFKALDRRPKLVVDAEGVFDRVTSPSRRFAWADIRGLRLSPANTRSPRVLAIDVHDPVGARLPVPAWRTHADGGGADSSRHAVHHRVECARHRCKRVVGRRIVAAGPVHLAVPVTQAKTPRDTGSVVCTLVRQVSGVVPRRRTRRRTGHRARR